ncbi:13773_t:CDS:2 [Dentiscutata erythropus]|uniref:13773_t:CDS:1 n=1 Tax=Dentiscutata erythropus TaxID=1348616 RepID=A0A9N9IM68_9GLOM|nr:13773_t:CDS:2 [Dentiscutata erythropus]
MNIITLNCLIQESKNNKAFPIEINRNKTIHQLKEVIEKRLPFHDFNAYYVSDYFTDKSLCKYIHIIVRPPIPPVKFDLVTLCEGLLCTKNEKYSLFIEFIRVPKGLKPNPFDFRNIKINDMTFMYYIQIEISDSATSEGKLEEPPNIIETIP